MKKMYLRKRKTNKFVFLLIIIIISLIISFKFFNNKAKNIFIEYSVLETKKIVSSVIMSSVNNHILNNIDINNLILIMRDNNNNIQTIDLNTIYINSILNEVASVVDSNLNNKLNTNYSFKLPSGIIFNNGILVNLFPKIPIKLNIIGNTMCVINTKIESYGINNAIFKLNIDITVDVKILLPFISRETIVTASMPIIIKLIEGSVPGYYLGGYLNNSFSN